jgi:hypothetical protein
MYCMYVRTYVCMGVGGRTTTFNDLLCFPFLIAPLLIPHLEWSVGLCRWGRHSSHLVPWRTGTGNEILYELQPHNHIECVWLIRHLLGTLRKWGHQSIPILKRCPFRWQCPAKSPTTHLNWSPFNFNRSFVLLTEGLGISPFAYLSQNGPVADVLIKTLYRSAYFLTFF